MRTNSLAVLGAAIVAVSCGGSPAPKPGPPVLIGLSVVGPATFSPDETGVPYTANGRLSDGTTENYTTKVTWNSGNPQVLSISSGGLASGKNSGEATIAASSGRFSAGLNVIVIPGGTYRLIGKVTDSGFPVSGAQVVVVAGHGSGLLTTTDFLGQYRLYGARGDIEVKVTKAGYEPLTKAMTVTRHDVLDFPDLRQVGAPALAGTYTMTITASPNCPTTSTPFTPALPDYARQRSYTAAIVQTGSRLDVTLNGADFLIQSGSSNTFTGHFEPDRLTFELGGPSSYYYYNYFVPDYSVVEKLPNNEFFTFWGKVTAVMSKTSISGPFDGGLMVFTGSTLRPVQKGVCGSGGQVSLVPQTAATRRR